MGASRRVVTMEHLLSESSTLIYRRLPLRLRCSVIIHPLHSHFLSGRPGSNFLYSSLPSVWSHTGG